MEKPVQLVRRPLGHQFDSAVLEISHKSCHRMALRDLLRGVSKADPLNPAAVEDVAMFELGGHLRNATTLCTNSSGFSNGSMWPQLSIVSSRAFGRCFA